MEKEVRVAEVQAFKTRSGNTRYVLRDDEGNEYTTFKEPIARQAVAAEGRRAKIRYHEQERDGFQNVYLDAVEPLEEDETGAGDRDADQAAWDAAIEAAPWLVGSNAPRREIPPEEFFEKLKPFKDLVAEDIKEGEDQDETGGGRR
jgi:hypothetical protein